MKPFSGPPYGCHILFNTYDEQKLLAATEALWSYPGLKQAIKTRGADSLYCEGAFELAPGNLDACYSLTMLTDEAPEFSAELCLYPWHTIFRDEKFGDCTNREYFDRLLLNIGRHVYESIKYDLFFVGYDADLGDEFLDVGQGQVPKIRMNSYLVPRDGGLTELFFTHEEFSPEDYYYEHGVWPWQRPLE